MELDAGDVVALDDRGEALAVLAAADDVVLVLRPADERVHVVEGDASPRPSVSASSRSIATRFHPMCGSLGASSGVTSPGSRPSPAAPSCSAEASNSSCMPRQIPSTGVPLSARSRITSSSPSARSRRIASGNAPTPGTTTASAERISSWSAVRRTSAPTCSSAFSTERRLPIP